MLVARDLCKSFGERRAVDGVSFEVAAGETYGLLGPNGAGKTTTISMIAGVQKRDAGSVHIGDLSLDAGALARARIGLVPQEITLYPDLTARENLLFWGRLYDLRAEALDRAVEAGLDAVQLADRADDRVADYSGGMKRRLNLVAGILHSPLLLILDEPTAGVDPQSRSAIFELVERLRDGGMAVVYTTHYMEEAERLCARIGIIDHGRLIAEGTRDELVAHLDADVRIEVGFEHAEQLSRAVPLAQALPWVRGARSLRERLEVLTDGDAKRMPTLLSALADAGLAATLVEVIAPNLEDVFLDLTGRELRDP